MFHCSTLTREDLSGVIEVMNDTGFREMGFPRMNDEQIKRSILESDYTFLVCYEKKFFKPKHIVGYFLYGSIRGHLKDVKGHFFIDENYAYHMGVGIHSMYRGRGLARKLLLFGLKHASHKFSGMYADIASDNIVSLKLHESLGFKKLGEYISKKRAPGVKNVVFVLRF
jgi:ribosomal protein S18 acetylase RimI-like enzyme